MFNILYYHYFKSFNLLFLFYFFVIYYNLKNEIAIISDKLKTEETVRQELEVKIALLENKIKEVEASSKNSIREEIYTRPRDVPKTVGTYVNFYLRFYNFFLTRLL